MPAANEIFLEFRNLFVGHPLFLVGLLLWFGFVMGKLAALIRLPEISGYIIAGLAVNSFTSGIVNQEMNVSLHVVTEVAIGFLALTIGGELSSRKLRRIGKDVVTITVVHLVGTFALVLAGCWLFDLVVPGHGMGYPTVILLAVIACATSPAVIVAEVHHMRAHGRFIDYLFGIVALGDIITAVVFGLAFTLVFNLLGAPDASSLLVQSIREIVTSLMTGLVFAVPLAFMANRIRNANELMILTISAVFVITGVSLVLHLSPLLVNMALGAALINFSSKNQRIFHALEPFTPPIYALFFVIAGLEINPQVFFSLPALAVGLGYMLLRGLAKCWSTSAGCRLRGLNPAFGRHLGMCMISKGGIALGFILLIQTSPALESLRDDPEVYDALSALVNLVLMSIFVNEVVSPFFLRHAVTKGNEMEG